MRKYSDELKNQVKTALELNNSSIDDITKKFNVSRSYVKSVRREFNIIRTYVPPVSKETSQNLSKAGAERMYRERMEKFKNLYTEAQINNVIHDLSVGGQPIKQIAISNNMAEKDVYLIKDKKIFQERTKDVDFDKVSYVGKSLLEQIEEQDNFQEILIDLAILSKEEIKEKYGLSKFMYETIKKKYNIKKSSLNKQGQETYKFIDEHYNDIVEYLQNHSQQDTARHFKISAKQIKKIYDKENIALQRATSDTIKQQKFHNRHFKYTEEQVKLAISMLLEMKNLKDIQIQTQLPYDYILKIRNKNLPQWEYLYKNVEFTKGYKRICECCGKEFIAIDNKTIYCDKLCAGRANREKNRHILKCACCGKEFSTVYPNVIYCSVSCASKINAQKQGFGTLIRNKTVWNKGLKDCFSEETNLKKSDSETLAIIEGKRNHPIYRSDARKRADLNCYFRSSYEANIARYFNYVGIKWEFEKHRVFLDSIQRFYVPDFYLPETNTFVEVKGLYREDALEKLVAFISENNEKDDYNVEIIDVNDYAQLYDQFCNIIPNWEKHLSIPNQSNFT